MIAVAQQRREQLDQLGLPWDLTEWIDREDILRNIAKVLDCIDWADPNLIAFEQKNASFRPKMFLTLLPYAYAIGLYASQDIVDSCFSDSTLRSISAGDPPRTREIMAFRRENRGLLRWVLVELFKQAIRAKFELGEFFVPAGLKRSLADAATERLDVARHIDRGAREE
jgi:hypothetical protein